MEFVSRSWTPVLRRLADTEDPLTDKSVTRPLLEAFGLSPGPDLEAMRAQLRAAFTDPAIDRIEGSLVAVTRMALEARPAPVADQVLLVRCVVALRTAVEWAAGTRRDADWRAGIERPMVRPPPGPAREAASSQSQSIADSLRAALLRRRPATVPRQARAPIAVGRPADTRTPKQWQQISGLANFAADRAVPDSEPEPEPQVPAAEPSRLESVGSQDLLIVRTRHIGYRLAELSRIENIAPGEARDRRHTVKTESASTFFEEVEHEKETTDSLATTTRDELRTEIANQTTRDLNLKGTVRTSYRGPVNVDAEASAEFGQQSEVRTTTTGAHAIEVVAEASTKVRDRVLQRTEHRFRQLIAERNRHTFANDTETGRVPQYYWLEKVQRAAVYNYGKRQMYEFVIPEPASYLRALSTLAPPPPSSVAPPPTDYYTDILSMTLLEIEDEYTSGRLAQQFTVTVDERPAATWIDGEIDKEEAGKPDETRSTAGMDMIVPAGYEGVRLRIAVQTGAEDKTLLPHLTLSVADLAVHLQARTLDDKGTVGKFGWLHLPSQGMDAGDTRVHVADAQIPPGQPPLVEGTYKVRLLIENFSIYSVTVGMLAVPTEARLDAYRRSILAAVVTDYQRRYENFAAQAVTATPGGPTLLENLSDAQSAELRTIEHDEVKRAALAVIRNADPVGPNPIADGGVADVATWFRENRALADEILFLEQAFEWEHMNVVLYGYPWSDPNERALQVFGVRGGDRPFREFLKAGAARVQIPVRPGFAGFVDDYMMGGVVWSGGPRPQIGSPGYIDFITELRAQLGAPGLEVPVTEEAAGGNHRPVYWDVVTPTDLVLLKVWDEGRSHHWSG